MKPLKIGYSPLSSDFKSPGDRRRLLHWAKKRGHTVTSDMSQKVDIFVASESSDLNSNVFRNRDKPLLFDLIDGYLNPDSYVEDLTRGVAKKLNGQLSGHIKPFSSHVEEFCALADGVICSSIEQSNAIDSLNKNCHIILDFHEEIPINELLENSCLNSRENQIIWEGQSATLPSLRIIAESLRRVQIESEFFLNLVTDESFYMFMNRYFKRDTRRYVASLFSDIDKMIRIHPWSVERLQKAASQAKLAIIPLDLDRAIFKMKPENRLLIMWRLGLPTLTSPSPSYQRVMRLAGADGICNSSDEWCEKISSLLKGGDYWRKQVHLGQDYIRTYHSETIVLEKWDTAVQSVIDTSIN